jgi:hypothetical protein
MSIGAPVSGLEAGPVQQDRLAGPAILKGDPLVLREIAPTMRAQPGR